MGGLASCSTREYALQPTTLSPASSGEIKVEKDEHDNLVVEIDVKYMPLPESIDPKMSTYVVWIQPANSTPFVNAGKLRLKKDREAEIEFRTPPETFGVIIRAESRGEVGTPSNNVTLC